MREEGEEEELVEEKSMAEPGDIHRGSLRAFWSSLRPGVWVKENLQNGYKIPFVGGEEPVRYEEQNNASSKRQMDFVREHVRKLLECRVVRKVSEQPTCVNPLTVASKVINEEGEIKHRMCLDLGRLVNPAVRHESSKLATFRTAVSLVLPGDYQAVYDLASAYHHVHTHAESQQFLGFMVPTPEGKKEFYVFCRLPFGLKTAGQVLDRILKPVCACIGSMGIRHSIYI